MTRLFFDIETRADPEAVQYLPEPRPPKNYKDAEKIEQWIMNKQVELLEKAALDPDTGNIVAVAIRRGVAADIKAREIVGKYDADDEGELLRWFWDELGNLGGYSCGYNILGFDLPFILRRSFALAVLPSLMPSLARYQTEPSTDLFGILYNWSPGGKGLKFVCERYGIPNTLPELHGGQVGDMDAATLKKYVANDVRLVSGLFMRMNGVYFELDN